MSVKIFLADVFVLALAPKLHLTARRRRRMIARRSQPPPIATTLIKMPLALPKIDAPLFRLLACSGVPLDADPSLKAWFENTGKLNEIAKLDATEDPRWIRLIIGQFESGKGHFHLEVARGSAFSKLPKETTSLERIGEIAGFLFGKHGYLYVDSELRIKANEIPKRSPLSAFADVEMSIDGTNAALAGGRLVLKASKYRELRWETLEDVDEAAFRVSINAVVSDNEISRDVLLDAERLALAGFDRFVLGKRKTGKAEP